MPERFAIYYAPAADDPLQAAADSWYAANPAITVSARRYGFHATIKPPMALGNGMVREELEDALGGIAETTTPVPVGPLVLRPIGGFVALVPDAQPQALTDFAAHIVHIFDSFREPLTAEDRTKRLPGLTPRQVALLDEYGYPYVMDQFLFHMTLTDQLPQAEVASVLATAATHFAPFIGHPLVLDRLVLFHEPQPGAAFVRPAPDYPLRG